MEYLQALGHAVGELRGYHTKTASTEVNARHILGDADDRTALGLVMSLRNLYGIDAYYWEPETIVATLKHDDLVLSSANEDRLFAGVAVIHNPACFWDNLVFQRTVQSFNSVPYDPEVLQECNTAHMHWTVQEASALRGLDPEEASVPELDEDVQQYIAVCMCREGFITTLPILKDIRDNLLKMLTPDTKVLAEAVADRWNRVNKSGLADRVFKETPADVQLAKLAAAQLYMDEQTAKMSNEIALLEHKNIVP